MAFTPNIDYVGHLRSRQRGLEGVTKAKAWKKADDERKAREAAAAAAAAAAKRSRKVGMGRKIVGAVARGAAAYYTGGASEASGFGAMMDQQIQGGAGKERNEYGDLVGAASTMSGMMTAQTAGAASTRLNAQSARDDQMQERMDKISPEAGLAFAQKRELKDAKNREVFKDYKDGFLNFGKDVDGLDLSSTVIDYSGIKPATNKATPVAYDPATARGRTDGIMKTGGDTLKASGIVEGSGATELLEGKGMEGDPMVPSTTGAGPNPSLADPLINTNTGVSSNVPNNTDSIKYENTV